MEREIKKREAGEAIISQEVGNLKRKNNKYRYFTKCEPKDNEWEKRLLKARKKRYVYESFETMLVFCEVNMMNSLKSKSLPIMKQLSRGIQTLKLDFRPMGRNLGKEYAKLREIMKRYHGLRTFHLWVRTGIDDWQLEGLGEIFKGLKTLRNLEVDFGIESRHRDGHLEILRRSVKKMVNLKSFKFHCEAEEMTAKGLAQFSNELKNLSSIENISLNFSCFKSKIFEGLRAGLNGMDPRTDINLQFSHLSFDFRDNEELETLQETLQECDFIENLGLEFNGLGDIINKGVEGLIESLEILQLLKHFGFYFKQNISEEMQEALIENLPILSFLESIHLQFPVEKPIGSKLILVSETLKKFQFLQDLNLICYGPSDEGLNALGQIFEELPLLKNVDLFLLHMWKPWQTKEGFIALIDGLRKAQSLEKLSLYLSNFSEIDDQDIKQLIENLENLPSLKKLALYFDKLPKLTEEGVEAISQSLKRMGSLERVKLGFFECPRVNKQSVDTMVQNFEELPFKIYCSLNFNDFFRFYHLCR